MGFLYFLCEKFIFIGKSKVKQKSHHKSSDARSKEGSSVTIYFYVNPMESNNFGNSLNYAVNLCMQIFYEKKIALNDVMTVMAI